MSKALVLAVFERDLPAPEKHVLTIMAWFGSDDGTNIFPSIETLCHHTGYRRRNVQKIIDRLKKRGILVLQMRMGRRRGFVPVYKMELNKAPLLPPESVHSSAFYGDASNRLATVPAGDSVHSTQKSMHSGPKECTPVRDSVHPSAQDQYLISNEKERIVASQFSISDSQNQTQQQNLPDKGKSKPDELISTGKLLRDLQYAVGSKARKSPLADDQAYEQRMAELKAQAAKAHEIVAKMNESGKS